MNETKNIDLIELVKTLKADAIRAARLMNDQYVEGDVERNHTNCGKLIQALRVLRMLGHEATDATWGQGGLLVCEKITIDGEVVYRR